MEDHRLKAFCLIVEMKSFSKAAEAKFMTQSALSHLIKNLEDKLGIKLLNRHAKEITPTKAGELFYEHAKQILTQYKELENSIYTVVQKTKGILYIGATPTVAVYLLPQVFHNFSKDHPEIQIELSVTNNEKIIQKLQERKIDIGVVEGKILSSKIYLDDITEDEIVIIASADNPITKKKYLNPFDLRTQSLIMPEKGSGIREFIDDFLNNFKIDPKEMKILMTVGNAEVIVRMVQSGMGVSLVSKWSVLNAIKDGSIKLLNLSDKKMIRKFYLATLDKEPSNIIVKTFKEFLKEYKFFIPS